MYELNEFGIEQIRQQLINILKPTPASEWLNDEFDGSIQQGNMLFAWACDLEQQMDEYVSFGNADPSGAEVEVDSYLTKSGHVQSISVDRLGYDLTDDLTDEC
jgi:hypothetical protein|tara:strand:- start:1646 stop:1954 length:309 start_codon:yes stop_codon:yes gene_type:complete